ALRASSAAPDRTAAVHPLRTPAAIRHALCLAIARAFLERGKDAIRRHWQIVEPQPDRIGDSIGQRRQERRERAFAGFLGAERPVRIDAFDDTNLDRRRILYGRHAVVEHIGSEHQPVVVGRLLAHGLAHAHPDRTLDLAFDGESVERLAAIMRDPDLVHGDDAGLLVDTHFDDLRRIAVTHGAADRRAAIFLAAVRLWNRRVVAGDGDGAGIFERFGDDFVEGQPLVLRAGAIEFAETFDLAWLGVELARGRRDQDRLEVPRRLDRGITDHESDARGIGAVILRHHFAVAADDADAREIKPEHLGDALHQHRG